RRQRTGTVGWLAVLAGAALMTERIDPAGVSPRSATDAAAARPSRAQLATDASSRATSTDAPTRTGGGTSRGGTSRRAAAADSGGTTGAAGRRRRSRTATHQRTAHKDD